HTATLRIGTSFSPGRAGCATKSVCSPSIGSCNAGRARCFGSRAARYGPACARVVGSGRAWPAVVSGEPRCGLRKNDSRQHPPKAPRPPPVVKALRSRSSPRRRTRSLETGKAKRNNPPLSSVVRAPGWPSGQRRQTQDLLSQEFPGSNPGPGSDLRCAVHILLRHGSPRGGRAFRERRGSIVGAPPAVESLRGRDGFIGLREGLLSMP